jgi:bifunctional DNA-binding transcriptional regulator/antitoxin component of YhaV-PrlF toxin-antitoxin module
MTEVDMTTSKVADDGQVTSPKLVLDTAGLVPGSEVAFRNATDGSVVIERVSEAKPLDPDRFEKVRGIAGRGPSTDEIMAELRGD